MLEGYRRLAELLPGAYLLVGTDGTIHAVNRRAVTLFGVASGRPLADFCARGPAEVAALLRQFARSSSMVPGALSFHGDGGTRLDARVEGALLQQSSETGEALLLLHLVPRREGSDRFIALNQRIDELNREIARRKHAEDDVARQREWLRITLSSIGDAVIATDMDGNVTFLNPVAQQLTGWPEADALGQPLEDVFRIFSEDSLEPVDSPVAQVLREGGVVGLANHTLLIARDGTRSPIDDSAAPIIDDRGHLIGVVLVFHDVTERSAMERELARRAEALEDADRRKNEFLAMLAHELRNPLAPLRSAADILDTGRVGPDVLDRLGQMMRRQVGLLTRMVDDLLDVARITRGKIEMRYAATTLDDVLERALDSARPEVERHGHRLTIAVTGGDTPLLADLARLAQAVANVLFNAAKFTPPGGEIGLEARCADDAVVVRVRDNGIGMEPQVAASAFDLFAQGEQGLDRGQGGLGIGLTLVRTIVELHGGTAAAESAGPGRGSVITLSFPARSCSSAPRDVADATRQDASRTEGLLRILIVDDNRDAAETLQILVSDWGHAVRTASNGAEALALLDAFSPELALIDIGMPGLDGYALAQRLRSHDGGPSVLIAVTGYGTDEAKSRAREAGFDAHVTKPAEPDQLQATIARLVTRARRR